MSDTTSKPAIKKPYSENNKMSDAMRSNPNLPVILMRFHIGGCSLCGYEEEDTIAEVAEANGVPTATLLEAMNA